MHVTFRNGFYAGVLGAIVAGLYLFQLWQPEKQVRLHSLHLISALERKDWAKVGEFVDESYTDRWGHDRGLLLARLRAVLPFARNLHIELMAPAVSASSREGEWCARLKIEADENEVSTMIKARVNKLDAPFQLHWRRFGKLWEWKLMRADNSALELPNDF